jgi:hypothetical protein
VLSRRFQIRLLHDIVIRLHPYDPTNVFRTMGVAALDDPDGLVLSRIIPPLRSLIVSST